MVKIFVKLYYQAQLRIWKFKGNNNERFEILKIQNLRFLSKYLNEYKEANQFRLRKSKISFGHCTEAQKFAFAKFDSNLLISFKN